MPFDPLCTIALSEVWQVTPVTDANFFKFSYPNNSGYSYIVVAQAQVSDGKLELFGAFRFSLKGQGADIAELEDPRVFNPGQRCLAVRGVGPAHSQTPKSLDLLVEETSMLILNPSGTTTKQKITDFLQTDAANREMVPANADRNGGTIFNKGSKAIWVGFGVNADKGSPNKILPGGQMDIPHGFTGAINGLFDALDASPSAKAIVEEMVAG
jgi:hypothetical protein